MLPTGEIANRAEEEEESPGGFLADRSVHTNATRTTLRLEKDGPANMSGDLVLEWNPAILSLYTGATSGTLLTSPYTVSYNAFNTTTLYAEGKSPGTTTLQWRYSELPAAKDEIEVKVFRLTMITPAGDPVNDPRDSGDGQNEFTYSAANPGVLNMNLKALVEPSGVASNLYGKTRFTVDAIGSSILSWDDQNPNGLPTINGNHLIATVSFTNLPVNNTDFGEKKAALYFDGTKYNESTYEVFFPRDATNHLGGQSGSPNWFHYWKQVANNSSLIHAGDSGGPKMAEVKGMSQWSYMLAPDKINIFVYNQVVSAGRPYGVGEYLSGIDMFVGTVIHENQHVIQIQNADALLTTSGSDSFRHGWSWNQSVHNHWEKGVDAEWGTAGVDDDGNGITDDANPFPPFEPGNGDDVTMDHAIYVWWPSLWTLPVPNNVSHPIESDAVNATDNALDEDDYSTYDWGSPGKQHQTLQKWND